MVGEGCEGTRRVFVYLPLCVCVSLCMCVCSSSCGLGRVMWTLFSGVVQQPFIFEWQCVPQCIPQNSRDIQRMIKETKSIFSSVPSDNRDNKPLNPSLLALVCTLTNWLMPLEYMTSFYPHPTPTPFFFLIGFHFFLLVTSFQISTLVWTSRATTLRCVKRSRPRTLGACALKTVRRTRSQFARPMEQRMITSASLKEKCAIWRRILHFTILAVALVSEARGISR